MSRNGSGGYALPINGWNPAVNGVSATPADWQALIDDVAAAIQASVAADGQTPMSGNLPMGGYRLTGAGAPSGAGMSLRWEQLIRGADIASAATITIPLEGQLFAVTGSTAITAINATIAGRLVYLKFDAGIVLTHSANLLMPSGVNVTTGSDDVVVFASVSSGVWRCVSYPRFESANYPSAAEPTITWPYMTWADTGNMLLKRRNAVGTAWVTVGPLLSYGSAALTFKAAPSAASDDVVVQSQVLGFDQTWQDVTLSRINGTTYTNTTGKPIVAVFEALLSATSSYISIKLNGIYAQVSRTGLPSPSSTGVSVIVPPGSTYIYEQSGAASSKIWEYRS